MSFTILKNAEKVSKLKVGTSSATPADGELTVSGNVTVGGGTASSLVSGGDSPVLSIGGTDSGLVAGEKAGAISFITSDSSYTGTYSDGICGEITSVSDSATGAAYGLAFYTATTTGSNRAERLRISSTGAVGFGVTENQATKNNSSSYNSAGGFFYNGAGSYMSMARAAAPSFYINRMSDSSQANGDGQTLVFRRDGTDVGSVSVTSSATAYNTSSDYRLKENLTPLTGALDRIDQLPVYRFNFIADPDTTVDGFVAHEVQAHVPEAITGEKDAMKTVVVQEAVEAQPATYYEEGDELPEGKEVGDEKTPAVEAVEEVTEEQPDYQGIDQSKLVPLLVAAVKELKAKVETLENA